MTTYRANKGSEAGQARERKTKAQADEKTPAKKGTAEKEMLSSGKGRSKKKIERKKEVARTKEIERMCHAHDISVKCQLAQAAVHGP